MPDPPSGGARCTFQGLAAGVHARGRGWANLLVDKSTSGAARVRLEGAAIKVVGGGYYSPTIVVERPLVLDAMGMNSGDEAPYAVSYRRAEGAMGAVIDVEAGGGDGFFTGALPDGARCDGCRIEWRGAKRIDLRPAGAEPIALTGPLPFGPRSRLDAVEIEVESGTLACEGEAPRSVRGRCLRWERSDRYALALGPLRLEAGGLRIDAMENDAPPAVSMGTCAPARRPELPWIGGGVAALVALGAIVGGALLRRAQKARAALARPPAASPAEGSAPLLVFYSCTPEDAALRDELEKHLAPLERRGLIRGSDADRIAAGADRQRAIEAKLDEADIVLALISADYLASEDCFGFELTRAAAGRARVVPVLLRACDWRIPPLDRMSILPADGRSVEGGGWPTRDAAFEAIVEGLKQVIEAVRAARGGEGAAARHGEDDGRASPPPASGRS